jgi:hypothetical protein
VVPRVARIGELQAACADGLDLDKIADRVITGLLGETGNPSGGFADDVTLLLEMLQDLGRTGRVSRRAFR